MVIDKSFFGGSPDRNKFRRPVHKISYSPPVRGHYKKLVGLPTVFCLENLRKSGTGNNQGYSDMTSDSDSSDSSSKSDPTSPKNQNE